MNFKRAARKALSGLLSTMMVVTQLSNNFTAFAEEIPADEPAGEVASTPVETTEEPTPEVEAPQTEEVVPEQPAEVTSEPEADPVENPEPSEIVTEEEMEPEDSEKEEKEPNVRTVYEGYGEGVSVSVTLTDTEAIADDAVLNVEFIPTEDPTELIYDIYFTEDKEEGVVRTDLKSGSANVVMTFTALQLTDIIQATDNADLVLFDGNGAVLPSVPSIADQKISYTVTSIGKVRIFNQNYPKEETKEEKSDEDKEEAHSRTVYTGAGDGIAVTAVLDDAAAIPDDAELSVYKVSESETAIAYDISFVGPEKDEEGNPTGNTVTYEPENGSVHLTVQFLEGQLSQQLGVQSADQVEVVHLPNSAIPESVSADVSVEAEAISFSLTSFSVVIFGKSWENPERFAPPADQSNIEQVQGFHYTEGEVIQFLLTNYGIVSYGDVKMDNHTMCAVLIGGNLSGTGAGRSGFGDLLEIAQRVSSYVKGSVMDFGGTSASRDGGKDKMPLYLGTENKVQGYGGTPENPEAPYGWELYMVYVHDANGNEIPVKFYNNVDSNNAGNPIYLTEDYVNFDQLYDLIKKESETLLEQGKDGRPSVSEDGTVLTIAAGQYVTIEDLTGIRRIVINGDLESAKNTIINIPQEGMVDFPELWVGTQQPDVHESGTGTAIVWNIPNATEVDLPSQNWAGHIIAPNAHLTQLEKGNYNGCFIVKSMHTTAEGHSYQYHGGKLIESGTVFYASKSWGVGAWPDGATFTATISGSTEGSHRTTSTPMPPNQTVTLTKENHVQSFGEVKFSVPKIDGEWDETYVYKVVEENEGIKDVIYDSTIHYVKVVVHYKYNEEQKIQTSEVKSMQHWTEGGSPEILTPGMPYTFGFTNNSEQYVTTHFDVTKKVKGFEWGEKDSFTFKLTPTTSGCPMPEGSVDGVAYATATKLTPTVQFGDITFKKDGTYSYYIEEMEPSQKIPGVIYDTKKHLVTVKVTDEMKATVVYDNNSDLKTLEITNKYNAIVKANLSAKKAADKTLGNKTFQFELLNDKDSVIETSKPVKQGETAAFTAIEYSLEQLEGAPSKDFTYKIKEVIPADAKTVDGKKVKDGVTYDETVKTVVVTVTDNDDGTLSIAYDKEPEFKTPEFKNSYAAEGSAELSAKKKANPDLGDNEFTFELKDADGKVIETSKPVKAGDTATFKTIKYTLSQLDGKGSKEFKYSINEVVPAGVTAENPVKDGIRYDTHVEYVTVTVTDNKDGTLGVAYNGKDTFTTPEFENLVNNGGLYIQKSVEGTTDKTKEFQFEVTLKAPAKTTLKDTYPAKYNGKDTTVQLTGGKTTVTLKADENYEILGLPEGTTYTVTENSIPAGYTLKSSTGDSGKITADGATASFVNTYSANGTATLSAKKAADKILGDRTFQFELLNDKSSVIETSKPVKQGETAPFTALTYSKADLGDADSKVFTYIIREKLPDGVDKTKPVKDGVTYDTHEQTVAVTVTDNKDGTLEVTYEGDKTFSTPEFENSYAATGSITFKGTKSIDGRSMSPDDMFTFTVSEGDEVIAEVTNNADGTIPYPTINYTLEDAGKTHTYTVKETSTSKDDITVDTKAYTVTVKVSDNGNGTLKTETKDDYEHLDFVNTYDAKGTATLSAKKKENVLLGENTFEFELRDETGKVIETSKPVKAGDTATFKTIEFKLDQLEGKGSKEFTYTINEKLPEGVTKENPVKDGITYDVHEETVKVKVTDNRKGQLTVTYNGKDSFTTPEFENTYDAKGKYVFEGMKTLHGRELKDAEFSFTLSDEDGEIETVKNGKDGKITFSEIEFKLSQLDQDEKGNYIPTEFKYTIKEVAGDAKGVTYDETTYEITLTVSDNGDGTLDVKSDGTIDEIEFINECQQQKGEGEFIAKKVLRGNQKLKDQQFTFELKDKDGKVLQSKKNDANGNVQFDKIDYEEKGEFVYTVSEVNDGQKDIIYDNSVYTITVKVEDGEDGKLKVTSVITKGGQVVEGIVFYNSTTPNTGIHNGSAFLTGAAAASLSGIAILEYLKRRQKNSKK